MNVVARLAGFGAVLAVVFAGATGVGRAVGPIGPAAPDAGAHSGGSAAAARPDPEAGPAGPAPRCTADVPVAGTSRLQLDIGHADTGHADTGHADTGHADTGHVAAVRTTPSTANASATPQKGLADDHHGS